MLPEDLISVLFMNKWRKGAWETGNSSRTKALSNSEAKTYFCVNVPKPVET